MSLERDRDDPAAGPIGRATGLVYWFVVIDLLVVLACLPGALPLMLLRPDTSNLPLVALMLLPVGPAVSAALFAWRDRDREPDQHPARHFWRGYRLNLLDVLRLWVPALALLAVLGVNAANLAAIGLPSSLGIALGVIALVVVLWAAHALVLVSVFAFRTRDVARLGIYYVLSRPLVTLGVVSLLVVTIGLVVLVSDYVLVFLASLLTFWLWRNARPMVRDVEARFLTSPDDAPDDGVSPRSTA